MRINRKIITAFALLLPLGMAPSAIADAAATSISSGGDPDRGQRVFNRCRACHTLTDSKRKLLGPNLVNLFGRQAGSIEGYKYSRALADADFVWTEALLDEWLTKPSAFLPGNKMVFAGLRKEKDRKDLMAYLRRATVEAE